MQSELKAPKGQTNKFGGYKYRSCEDILEAVKPLCKKYNVSLILTDSLQNIGDRYYIQANAVLYNIEKDEEGRLETVGNSAYARESETKKGMDDSQITGTASSYARKYALNGLFNIDDTKDADTNEFREQVEQESEKIIDSNKLKALNTSITKNNISDNVVELILSQYGYTSTNEIKVKDYMNIVNDFKTKVS
ncbi:ERF family protein [Faecalibacillus faecis]|uniref:ERF family protein n=1 Tax=Faecalibacillus faecis TaxID=1982628 RepID=UPI00386EDE4A